jgi:exonuclease VII small subunit
MDIIPEEEKPEYAWLLRHCQAELAAAEKEMWEQYDEDDLRKLDLQNRGGF